MPNLFYAGQPDYIEKLNTLATAASMTNGTVAASFLSLAVTGTATAASFVGPLTGNASTATTLATARNINGVAFNGSADITVTAAAGTLTGTTLAANVVNASLNSITPTGEKLSVSGGLDVIGNITARLPDTSHSTHRGLKFGVTLYGEDYGGVTMRMDSGEVRYTAGYSGWGGFHTWYCNGVKAMELTSGGSTYNITGTYGTISDARLKRDVTDATGKLHKVLAMRIVNYYLKADPSNTKLLGMIAQELREISPGLVEETPDYADVIVTPARTNTVTKQRQVTAPQEVTRHEPRQVNGQWRLMPVTETVQVPQWQELPLFDSAGQPVMETVDGQQVQKMHRVPLMESYTETVNVPAVIESRPTGTTTLSIKYSVLVPMLIKALQEMHAEFDSRLKAIGA